MLELMMSRPAERVFLDRALSNLEFLVLDELHTYTGRQGADVSMLVRRVRKRCGNDDLLCIGTSATMVVGGTRVEQREAVADVTSKIFGVNVSSSNIIDEELKRSIQYQGELTADILSKAIRSTIPTDYESFVQSPLAAWIEATFGIEREEDYFKRRIPITLKEGARLLSKLTEVLENECEAVIGNMLLRGNRLKHPDGLPVFGVKLHQFISQGDSVYSTIEPPEKRYLTLSGQHWTESKNGRDRLLAPIVFCRICGQEYYQITLNDPDHSIQIRLPGEISDVEDEALSDGYLLVDNEDNPIWSEDREEDLPENWFRATKTSRSLVSRYKPFVPRKVFVATDGVYSTEPKGGFLRCWFIRTRFSFCPSCGIAYDQRTGDFAKLARLSSEGRSTATTLVTLSTVSQMQKDSDVPVDAQKVLSFTDNRQDASLQAGHFNDFILVGLIRSAIYRALLGGGYLDHTNIAAEVVKALNLPQTAYAKNPGEVGVLPKRNREAFTAYIEYRIYQDLRRGWRIVQPNLEQCGLLRIEHPGLKEVCGQKDQWQKNSILSRASTEIRFKVSNALLNHLRRSLAVDAECLMGVRQEALKRKVNQTLKEPWRFDDEEHLLEGKWFVFGNQRPGDYSLSTISALGKYLRSSRAWPDFDTRLDTASYEPLLRALIDVLSQAGYLLMEVDGNNFRIQLQVNSLEWRRGDGSAEIDPVRSMSLKDTADQLHKQQANRFFTDFYKEKAASLQQLKAGEHTGKTSREDRDHREKLFRQGKLSVLFCSPTMELGIDIADLNAVNMRNVPPAPSRYAQRSGRSGRSGQPAFITTYCSTWSGHDQYFFQRQPEIVAGVVAPPRLELANEDMLRSHLYAIWLGKVGLYLKDSIMELVDLSQDDLPLHENISHQINLSENRMDECLSECRTVIEQCKEYLQDAGWYSDEWLEPVVRSASQEFDKSFDRWRELYRIAHTQLIHAQNTLREAHRKRLSRDEKKQAERLEREAQRQKDLLCNMVRNRDDSDFYPYRYLASEGFLPGYNFPRLPVHAFIARGEERDTFISRPRFLAISEYGPRNVIYHEGRKYRVVKSLIPAGDPESRLTQAKLCKKCGVFHTGESLAFDLCEHCNTLLDANNSDFLPNLFEMTTVATQRADRITCDEEERVRQGYDITTHFRFSRDQGQERKSSAEVLDGEGDPILELEYGAAAQLWRINRRWRRSRDQGFTLDTSTGIWNKRLNDYSDTALDVGEDSVKLGTQIFVRDTRNILLVKPTRRYPLGEEELANLQHALHKGLSAHYQVDYNEISSERVGKGEMRGALYWEAAEGGVGVLQRLADESEALSRIAKKALQICHFDPNTGDEIDDDLDCARACYYCLLTYSNQRDHGLLNRHTIKDTLIRISIGSTQAGYASRSYDEQYEWLRQQTDKRSQLEKDFLDQLYRSGRRLPDAAQKTTPNYPSRPDFYYDDGYVCVFCDGSVHDEPRQKEEDQHVRSNLRKIGYRVVVIRYDQQIEEQINDYKDVFQKVR